MSSTNEPIASWTIPCNSLMALAVYLSAHPQVVFTGDPCLSELCGVRANVPMFIQRGVDTCWVCPGCGGRQQCGLNNRPLRLYGEPHIGPNRVVIEQAMGLLGMGIRYVDGNYEIPVEVEDD